MRERIAFEWKVRTYSRIDGYERTWKSSNEIVSTDSKKKHVQSTYKSGTHFLCRGKNEFDFISSFKERLRDGY